MDAKNRRDLFMTFVTLNHECLSLPFFAVARNLHGWTSHQLSAICYLKRYQELSMSELSDLLLITRQQTTQLVNGLVKHGLVSREHDPHDRRMVYIRPTELALDGLMEAETAFSQVFPTFLEDFSEEQQNRVLDAMHTMTQYLFSTEKRRFGSLGRGNSQSHTGKEDVE